MHQVQKTIQFGEHSIRFIPSRAELQDEEKVSVWYSGNELQELRNEAAVNIKEVLNKLDFTNQISFAAVHKRTYEACNDSCVPQSSDIKLLVNWAKVCPSRRGLEKFCVPDVANKTKERRRYAIRKILEVQQRTLKLTPEERSIRLQKASLRASLVTKTYARVLAIVDAAAAKEDINRFHNDALKSDAEHCTSRLKMNECSSSSARSIACSNPVRIM